MKTQLATVHLGQNILVIIDPVTGFFDAFRSVTHRLPRIDETLFTLFCCCPTRYWEHGGADSQEVRQEIENVWQAEEDELTRAEHCLGQARAILVDAGVPDSHIFSKVTTAEDSLLAATTAEVRHGHYSGVIVCRYHDDLVNRLNRKGITDVFRNLPQIEVCTLDL